MQRMSIDAKCLHRSGSQSHFATAERALCPVSWETLRSPSQWSRPITLHSDCGAHAAGIRQTWYARVRFGCPARHSAVDFAESSATLGFLGIGSPTHVSTSETDSVSVRSWARLLSDRLASGRFHAVHSDRYVPDQFWQSTEPHDCSSASTCTPRSRRTWIFGGEVLFEQAEDSFLIDTETVDRIPPTANHAMAAALDAILVGQLQELCDDDLVTRCRTFLLQTLTSGEPSEADLATAMGLSRRSLQRRLCDLGWSYKRVLDDTRANLARRYLANPRHQSFRDFFP